jgi:hypothetical protein
MSAKSFTERQGQYLAFIDAYTRVDGRPPAETDMQRHFGVGPPSVHQMVLTLERLALPWQINGLVGFSAASFAQAGMKRWQGLIERTGRVIFSAGWRLF